MTIVHTKTAYATPPATKIYIAEPRVPNRAYLRTPTRQLHNQFPRIHTVYRWPSKINDAELGMQGCTIHLICAHPSNIFVRMVCQSENCPCRNFPFAMCNKNLSIRTKAVYQFWRLVRYQFMSIYVRTLSSLMGVFVHVSILYNLQPLLQCLPLGPRHANDSAVPPEKQSTQIIVNSDQLAVNDI